MAQVFLITGKQLRAAVSHELGMLDLLTAQGKVNVTQAPRRQVESKLSAARPAGLSTSKGEMEAGVRDPEVTHTQAANCQVPKSAEWALIFNGA